MKNIAEKVLKDVVDRMMKTPLTRREFVRQVTAHHTYRRIPRDLTPEQTKALWESANKTVEGMLFGSREEGLKFRNDLAESWAMMWTVA